MTYKEIIINTYRDNDSSSTTINLFPENANENTSDSQNITHLSIIRTIKEIPESNDGNKFYTFPLNDKCTNLLNNLSILKLKDINISFSNLKNIFLLKLKEINLVNSKITFNEKKLFPTLEKLIIKGEEKLILNNLKIFYENDSTINVIKVRLRSHSSKNLNIFTFLKSIQAYIKNNLIFNYKGLLSLDTTNINDLDSNFLSKIISI